MSKKHEYLLESLKEKNETIKMLEGMLKERNDANRVLENRIWFLQNQGRKETLGGKDDGNKLVDVLISLFDNGFQSINKNISDAMQDIEKELKDIKKEQTKNSNQFRIVTNTVQEMSKELKNIIKGENKNAQLGDEDLNNLDPDDKSSPLEISRPDQQMPALLGNTPGFVHSPPINSAVVNFVSQPQAFPNKISPKPTFPASSLKQTGFGVSPSLVDSPPEVLLQENETPKLSVISSKAPGTFGFPGQSLSIISPASINLPSSKVSPVNVVITSSEPWPTFKTTTAHPILSDTKQTIIPVKNPFENLEPAKFSPCVLSQSILKIESPLKGKENAEIKFEERCRLYRLDKNARWKMHGVGNIKIVKEDTLRLVMRQDEGDKVYLNHEVSKDMFFKKKSTLSKAVRWDAQDFSEGILIPQKLRARFENNKLADNFLKAIRILLDVKDEVAEKKPHMRKIAPKSNVAKKLLGGQKFTFGERKPENTTTPMTRIYKPQGKFIFGVPTPLEGKSFRNLFDPIFSVSRDFPENDSIPTTELALPKVNTLGIPELKFNSGMPATSSAASNVTPSFSFGNSSALSWKPQKTIATDNVTSKDNDKSGDLFVFRATQKHDFEFKPRTISTGEEKESDVKTGEENEKVLYSHRAKLFRFTNGEWKERGLGDVKILKDSLNGKLRIVMRRDQVLKICLNHWLTKDIEYLPKDERTWLFHAADFSESELIHDQFCLRFKSAEIAQEFKKTVDAALAGDDTEQKNVDAKKIETTTAEESDSDVEFVSETQVTAEEEKEAVRLGLPPKFLAYRQRPDCSCDQCKKDDEYLKELFNKETVKPILKSSSLNSNLFGTQLGSLGTPSSGSAFGSLATSFTFGTPGEEVTPTIREPKAETLRASPFSIFGSIANISGTQIDKKNIIDKPKGGASIFDGPPKEEVTIFGTPKEGASVFAGPLKKGASFFEPPKEGASIFGGAPKEGIFGRAPKEGIFGCAPKEGASFFEPPKEGASIFGPTKEASNIFPPSKDNIFAIKPSASNSDANSKSLFTPKSNPFSAPTGTPNLFQSGPSSTNIFRSSAGTSAFGAATNTSLFGTSSQGSTFSNRAVVLPFGQTNFVNNSESKMTDATLSSGSKESEELMFKAIDSFSFFANLGAKTNKAANNAKCTPSSDSVLVRSEPK